MRLSNKVLMTLILIWILFMGASYLGAHQYLMKGFLKLEQIEINKNIDRVRQAIEQISYSLGTYTVDWSHWNDAYDFVEGINPKFVPDNIDVLALANSNINLLIYLNNKGEIQLGVAIDLKNKKLVNYPRGLERYIYPGSPLLKHKNIETNQRGLILLDQGIMLMVSAGVSHNDLTKPINGTLITGRNFSPELLHKIAENTSLDLLMILPNTINSNTNYKKILDSSIQSQHGSEIQFKNSKIAYGYLLLRDLFNKPIGLIQLTVPRNIIQTGKETINYYLGIFFVSGLILLMAVWYLLRVLVLKRLEQLNKRIRAISGKKDYSQRIAVTSNDELSSVTKQFNGMMQTVEQSDEQLKNQVEELSLSEHRLENTNKQLINEIEERKQAQEKIQILHNELILAARRAGMADIASGVIHNVGNILNSVTTSVAIIHEKMELSRAAKMTDLVDLLQQNQENIEHFIKTDPKGQKVIAYLGMLANAWSNENKNILVEINHLDKNINHIKTAIMLQQSMGVSIGMTEECDIKNLIQEALIINKYVYENAEVKIIEDYQFDVVVTIDRVKLLHVIVNLIKNSLQALLENNKPNKILKIELKSHDEANFVIKIIDNGTGILPENLTKIFSYGFSTKKGGHGFGLHTSATFVQEIRGKLSAENNEQGGATFTLILPIHQMKREADDDSTYKLQTEWEK